MVDQIVDITKTVLIVVAIIAPQLRAYETNIGPSTTQALEGIHDIYVTIENLTINM